MNRSHLLSAVLLFAAGLATVGVGAYVADAPKSHAQQDRPPARQDRPRRLPAAPAPAAEPARTPTSNPTASPNSNRNDQPRQQPSPQVRPADENSERPTVTQRAPEIRPPIARQNLEDAPGETPPPPDQPGSDKPQTFMPVVVEKEFEELFKQDSAAREAFNRRHLELLEQRYDLSDQPSEVMMSGGRKAVQQGVRVKLHGDVTWDDLAGMSPDEIKEKNLFPHGFRPLPHSKHETGGMVFPREQIEAIRHAEGRDLQRFDTDFDYPPHLTPEFPPPIFLSNRPELGDVSNGEVLTVKNFYRLLHGKITPVQMEGMRLLLTPFPQQQFNMTEDRKVKEPQLGVSCLDCHVNGHTNATFHLNPDTRPQENRFRIDTVSLRGMFNQQIHGSKRSLRSVEDFTEFEQRTAYFDGDHVIAMKKGVHLPNRVEQVSLMAQMQNMFDFPPAPKLDVFGRLDKDKADERELRGEELFFGKARCADCHPAPFFLDDKMHDLKIGRFYETETLNGQKNVPEGLIKTFTLRGIKDSPPYLHDGRLLTLEDTVEFFNLVLGVQLTEEEKADLTAYLRCL